MSRIRGYCKLCGKRTSHKTKNDKWLCTFCEGGLKDMSLDDTIDNAENEKIIKLVTRSGLSVAELKLLLKGGKHAPRSRNAKTIRLDTKKIIYGVISDSHIGSIYYDENVMDDAAKEFNKRNVDFVLHGGDICEGHYESVRHGHVFELEHIGGDAQVKRAITEMKKINPKTPIYLITGNHEYNTFYKHSGFEIGEMLEERLPNLTYLGNADGLIQLPFGKKIQMLHPDGGSSYAISYKSQKIVESLEGGNKPEVLHIGHFHKAEYLFYRNIHVFQNGCLQSQSKFMKGKHLSAHRGFWVIELEVNKDGVKSIKPQFFPRY